MDGGMRIPSVPPPATAPVQRTGHSPFSISGMAMAPTVTAQATTGTCNRGKDAAGDNRRNAKAAGQMPQPLIAQVKKVSRPS